MTEEKIKILVSLHFKCLNGLLKICAVVQLSQVGKRWPIGTSLNISVFP